MIKLVTAILATLGFVSVSVGIASAEPMDASPGAIVIDYDGNCGLLWLDATGEQISIPGDGSYVAMPNDQWYQGCRVRVDFDDPDLASFDQVCAALGDFCQANGAIVTFDLLFCFFDDRVTPLTQAIVTPSGQRMFTCQSNGRDRS